MSEAKHLPGPWRLSEIVKLDGRTGDYQRVVDGDGMGANIIAHVCVAHPANFELAEHGKANARLIAASPALYEALKLALQQLESLNKGVGWRDGEWHEVTVARAALSLAEGTTGGEGE